MSFRLRVFLLVMLVAITAIGATAWLTLSLASKQISDAVATSNRNTDVIAEVLGKFAHDRGTWAGVDGFVRDLSETYKVRIRMATINGQVIVDTDHLAKRAARPTVGAANLVDPRPKLVIPERVRPPELRAGIDPAVAEKFRKDAEATAAARRWVLEAIRNYRYTVHLTACAWTGQGLLVPLVDNENGVATQQG